MSGYVNCISKKYNNFFIVFKKGKKYIQHTFLSPLFHAHLEYSSTLYSLRDPGYTRLYHLEHWAEKGNMENCTADLKGFRSSGGARLTEHTFPYNSQAKALGQV